MVKAAEVASSSDAIDVNPAINKLLPTQLKKGWLPNMTVLYESNEMPVTGMNISSRLSDSN